MSFVDNVNQWKTLSGDEVMGWCYGALGDSFAMFSYTVLMGLKFGKPMKLSLHGGKKEENFKTFFKIAAHPEAICFTSESPTEFKKLFCTRKHLEPYCKLKYNWQENVSGPICFHYDRMTAHKRSERFPDDTEEKYFLDLMREKEAINISYPMPLEEVVQVSSTCSKFIGIESGISHLMHSVGIPIILRNWNGKWAQNNNKISMYHPNKEFTSVRNFYELKDIK